MYLLYLLAQLIKLKKTMKGLSRKHFINTDIVFWNIYKMLENFVMFLPISCCHQENEKKKSTFMRHFSVKNKIHFSDAGLISKTFPNVFQTYHSIRFSSNHHSHYAFLYSDKEIWFDASVPTISFY